MLGTMHGRDLTFDDVPAARDALSGSWFEPYFMRLKAACEEFSSHYGRWESTKRLEDIGDILEDLVAENGVTVTLEDTKKDMYDIRVPLAPETMP